MNQSQEHVAVVYQYGPRTDELHAEHGPNHVAFLRCLYDEGILVLSGRVDQENGPGALLVLAATPQEATDLLNDDPFWTAGVVADRHLWRWNIVFGAEVIR